MVRAQPVDAIPSSIKLLSKVVFVTHEKRFGLWALQKSDMGHRWKAQESLHEIGRALGKEHSSIRWCRVMVLVHGWRRAVSS